MVFAIEDAVSLRDRRQSDGLGQMAFPGKIYLGRPVPPLPPIRFVP